MAARRCAADNRYWSPDAPYLSRLAKLGTSEPGLRRIRSAIPPVHPVWCEAPNPAPLSPWKYSWNKSWSFQAGSRRQALDLSEARTSPLGVGHEE